MWNIWFSGLDIDFKDKTISIGLLFYYLNFLLSSVYHSFSTIFYLLYVFCWMLYHLRFFLIFFMLCKSSIIFLYFGDNFTVWKCLLNHNFTFLYNCWKVNDPVQLNWSFNTCCIFNFNFPLSNTKSKILKLNWPVYWLQHSMVQFCS